MQSVAAQWEHERERERMQRGDALFQQYRPPPPPSSRTEKSPRVLLLRMLLVQKPRPGQISKRICASFLFVDIQL